MRVAALSLALVLGAGDALAQDATFRVNPYAGWYRFDESSFEEAFDVSDVETDPVYGVRLAIGDPSGWSLDLAYGRTVIAAEGRRVDILLESDATIQLFYAALDWHLPLTGPLDLFASGGLGGISTDFEESDGSTDVLANYGVGIAVPVRALRFRADLKDQVDLCDAPEETGIDDFEACFEDEALHNIELTAGVEIPL